MKKHFRRSLIFILTLAFLVGCNPNSSTATSEEPSSSEPAFNYETIAGIYDLTAATLDETDIKNNYSLYQITLKADQTSNVFISELGQITNRNGTYSIVETTITEISNNGTFVYTYNFENKTLLYTAVEYGENLMVLLTKRPEDTGPQPVDFAGVLFGEKVDETKKFNYAPTVIQQVENGKNVMHIWYCTNKTTAIIMDHIGYRRGEEQEDGKWLFSEESIVLEPTLNTWDGRHTCDPSVIKGEFAWGNENYTYLMAYLGCVTDDYSNNETGIAVAKEPGGPWIKVEHINPIAPWARDNPSGRWGTGMPALLSVDKKGQILLYYMNTAVGVSVEKWDLSDLLNPVRLYRSRLINTGLQKPTGTPNAVSYVEMAYDEKLGRLYVLTGGGIKDPADGTRTLVYSHFSLAYIEGMNNFEDIDNAMINMDYTWKMVGHGGPEDTGFPRNHNSALVTDSYGYVINSEKIGVVTSTGYNTYPFDNIYTYRLCGFTFDVPQD